MTDLQKKLREAVAFEGTPLPFKHFPIVLMGEGKQYELINEYLTHGMKLAQMAPILAAIENSRSTAQTEDGTK